MITCKQVSLFSVCIATTAACIAPVPQFEELSKNEFHVFHSGSKAIEDAHDYSNDVRYSRWGEFKKSEFMNTISPKPKFNPIDSFQLEDELNLSEEKVITMNDIHYFEEEMAYVDHGPIEFLNEDYFLDDFEPLDELTNTEIMYFDEEVEFIQEPSIQFINEVVIEIPEAITVNEEVSKEL